MFAINGPSGPTCRCERRVVTDAERRQLEDARKQQAKAKSERFFDERPAAAASTSGSSAKSKSRTKAVAETTAAAAAKSESGETGDCTSASTATSQIFKGCRIVFNGRTGKISSYYLAKLVQDHGGNVCSAMATTRVTHMVGANLSGSKADKVIKRLATSKVKIVSPDWILQSVKHKKRMPEFEFLLYKDTQQLRIG